MVQSRLSAHIRPHAGGSSGLGGVRQWHESESGSGTYAGAYLDLSGSPLSHHRPADHAPLVSASGLQLREGGGAPASWNKTWTRAQDLDLDAKGCDASLAQELAHVEHVPSPPHCPIALLPGLPCLPPPSSVARVLTVCGGSAPALN